MAVMLKQDYGQWKKGEVITSNGGMAERLIGQGKAVPVKAPPSPTQLTPHQPPTSAASPQGEAFAHSIQDTDALRIYPTAESTRDESEKRVQQIQEVGYAEEGGTTEEKHPVRKRKSQRKAAEKDEP